MWSHLKLKARLNKILFFNLHFSNMSDHLWRQNLSQAPTKDIFWQIELSCKNIFENLDQDDWLGALIDYSNEKDMTPGMKSTAKKKSDHWAPCWAFR